MAQRTISKWRTIDQNRLLQRIKALSLGSDNPPEISEVRGYGAPNANGVPSRDTNWRQRLSRAMAPQPRISEQDAQIEFDSLMADKQLADAQRLSEE